MSQMTIETTVRIWREGKQFIAQALPIDVASAGDTVQSAHDALREALKLFFATARERGTINVVLKESGYTQRGNRWVA
jgi:predicted RNase H-like HicB family nuclease